jgi:sulfide dehydrogenase [flavocytochrome c] flavoprotein subunit
MSKFTRRSFLTLSGAGAAAGALGALGLPRTARAQIGRAGPHVIVVGGGFGGATCAKYLRRADADITVTLIEPNRQFITCPFSNYVIGGLPNVSMKTITHSYDALRTKHGVNVMHATVASIDPGKKQVTLQGGKKLGYDRLVLSPGIEFKWSAIEGYSEKAAEVMPHAWKAGPQTLLLRKKLEAMKNGGLFVMVAPPNPFRCPPGPYERASMIAHYLKQHKPRSKIVILDPKDDFSKKGLFMEGWKQLYGDMIEWVPGAKGGTVARLDTKKMIVDAALEKYKADVVNVIPPQSAGAIALQTGLADDKGWCPVDPKTFESKKAAGIHVIGDSSIAGDLPKSGFAASSEGKIAAHAIAALVRGQAVADASYVNTCYSLLAPDYGISVAGVYRVTEQGVKSIPGSGGVSPLGASAGFRADEAKYAFGWYASIAADVWG